VTPAADSCGSVEGAAVDGTASGLVIGILGPTGVGKTAIATGLARRLGTGVISCDSMQVYRGFPVLTNQPTPEELDGVTHELVGIVEPAAEFSAAEYACLARPLIDEDLARHGTALVVGGTGLYMRAALAPLAVSPAADLELRRALEARAAAEWPAALHRELADRDPAAAAVIDPRNQRRVIRALEVVILTGSAWSGRQDLWEPRYFHRTLLTALVLDRKDLYERIDARARQIVEGGAVEEVRRFREGRGRSGAGESGITAARSGIATAIGFAEIERYLDGLQTLDETVEQIAAATRHYARRQLTWLRKLSDLVIIDVHDRSAADLVEEILALVSSGHHVKEPQDP
jgi:tRNA dimethylallyltransferase